MTAHLRGAAARCAAILVLAAASLGLTAPPARAQEYPTRAVRVIVPYPAGGTTDILARLVAEGLGRRLGQPFIVENRPGAGTAVGAQALTRAAPDGHTLLVSTGSTTALLPLLHGNPGYSPDQMTGVAMLGRSPMVLDVPAQSPFRSVAELVAFGKANPGRLNLATQGAGATSHLTAELFAAATGITFTAIHYQGGPPGLTATIAGQVDFYFDGVTTSAPVVNSGRLRGLAVTSERRMPRLPDVPTLAEVGYPEVTVYAWYGLLVPAGTPASVIATLNAETNAIMSDRALQDRLATDGIEVTTMSAAEFVRFYTEEREMWRRVVAPLNIRLN